ncbi:peptidase M16 family protein [Dactylosporangium cerinum]
MERFQASDSDVEGTALLRAPATVAQIHQVADLTVRHPAFQPGYRFYTAHDYFAMLFSLAGDHAAAAPHFRALAGRRTRSGRRTSTTPASRTRTSGTARWREVDPVLHRTEVDGVPTLLAPSSGPMTAGLTFRVGLADEGAARIGITHLVEHLALHRHGVADYHYNGATGSVVTHFHMQGSERDIVTYLEMVCDSLADLPVQRLETEKAILRTEAAGHGGGVNRMLPMWRYGAQHYGLVSYPEWGIDRLGPDDVRAWANAWFTRANAVLWISGDRVPPGLRLRLPAGTLRPVPVASTVLPATPAYFTGAGGASSSTASCAGTWPVRCSP